MLNDCPTRHPRARPAKALAQGGRRLVLALASRKAYCYSERQRNEHDHTGPIGHGPPAPATPRIAANLDGHGPAWRGCPPYVANEIVPSSLAQACLCHPRGIRTRLGRHAKHIDSALAWRFSARPSLWHYAIAYGTIANILARAAAIAAVLAGLPDAVAIGLHFLPLPYVVVAVVGVWRSADKFQRTRRGRHRQSGGDRLGL